MLLGIEHERQAVRVLLLDRSLFFLFLLLCSSSWLFLYPAADWARRRAFDSTFVKFRSGLGVFPIGKECGANYCLKTVTGKHLRGCSGEPW